MGMDAFLADFYGTNKVASAPQEETEKTATVELFLKLAADQNIDLKSMSDADVQKLYDSFAEKVAAPAAPAAAPAPAPVATKTAAEDEAKKEHEKKLEEAKKEHEEKHAMAKKAAEADQMGRIMAHSFFQEYRKIAADLTKQGGELPPALAAHMHGKGEGEGKHEPPHHEGKEEKKEEKEEEKKASALDELGAKMAVAMAKEAGFDADQTARKVAAVLELGLAPQTAKTASVADVKEAIGIRALELLEKAGYPVTWKQ